MCYSDSVWILELWCRIEVHFTRGTHLYSDWPLKSSPSLKLFTFSLWLHHSRQQLVDIDASKCIIRSPQINVCFMALLPKEACNFTPQLRQGVGRVHNCQSKVTNWEERREINVRQNKGGRQSKCFKSTSAEKSFLLCFSLIPVALKLMTVAIGKWFPRPAACLCVNTFNYTTLNSPFPFRMKDRCGSQPASLNQVQERRRPLKAHQSESYLPLGRSESGNQCFILC